MLLANQPAYSAPKPRHKRGKTKMSERGKITREVHDEITERCGGVCELCGRRPVPGTKIDRLEAAHLVRRSQGGRGDQPWGVAMLCGPSVNTGSCHNRVDYTAAGRQEGYALMERLMERYDPANWPV